MRLRRRSAGFTLVEMCIAMGILGMVFGAIGMTMLTGTRLYEQGTLSESIEMQAHRLLERVAGQFAQAGLATLAPVPLAPFGSQRLDFRRASDYAGGAIVWTNTTRIDLQYVGSELNDGADNNGNGLIDECRVVLVLDTGLPTQRTIGWGGFVREYLEGEVPNGADDNGNGLIDERGLCFSLVDSLLTIRLTLERPDGDGGTILRTFATSVRIRN